jgi:prefoldin subunit 5
MTTEYPPVDAPPAETPPAEVPPAADAAPPPDVPPAPDAAPPPDVHPAPGAAATEAPPPRRRRDRVLGSIGQVVGVVGIVVCLLLVIGVIVGDVWAVRTVDDVAAAIDAKIAKAEPLLDQASAKVGEISGRVSTVADIAAGIAADPSPGGAVADALRAGLATVSDRYQTLRSNYAGVRESIQSVVDRLQTLDRLVPGISIPQGPADALAALDARLQEFDAKVTGLITIDPGQGPVNQAAAAIAQKAGDINTKITDLQGGIGDVQQRVSALRTKLSDTAGTMKLGVTLGAFGSILLLFYLALLHWVLFRHSGEIRRRQPAG